MKPEEVYDVKIKTKQAELPPNLKKKRKVNENWDCSGQISQRPRRLL